MCLAEHLVIRKTREGKKNQTENQRYTYYFEVEKCKVCSL